jgi:hypothetical protein
MTKTQTSAEGMLEKVRIILKLFDSEYHQAMTFRDTPEYAESSDFKLQVETTINTLSWVAYSLAKALEIAS